MSFLDRILCTIHNPGVNRKLIGILYAVSFVLLGLFLTVLLMVEGNKPQVWIVMVLAVALALTLVWFTGEMNLALKEHYASLKKSGSGKKQKEDSDTSLGESYSSNIPVKKHGLVRKR